MKGYIERIEKSQVLIVLKEGGELLLKRTSLPFPAREGMHVDITIRKDDESENNLRQKIRKLKEELQSGS
ncbi:MAG TPA: DUF3006 family protein [bacterium]|nr:DUF3006 family protein [bacterium]